MSRILIGTSGWSYPSWRGPFFPKNVMVKHHLQYYATQFSATELNGVFYRTPTVEAVRGWRDNTPDDFVFAWKASKFITHWKRLTGKSRNSLALLESRLRILGPKAGPILFQLPPQFTVNRERLAGFLKLLKSSRRYAFEFRHSSWYEQRSSTCCASTTFRSVFPTIMTRRRPGRSPARLCMCADTDRVAPTRVITPTKRCDPGPGKLLAGGEADATSMSTSTTIRKALRRRMQQNFNGCWNNLRSSPRKRGPRVRTNGRASPATPLP